MKCPLHFLWLLLLSALVQGNVVLAHPVHDDAWETTQFGESISSAARDDIRRMKKVGVKGAIHPRGWPLKAFVPRKIEVFDVVERQKEKEELRQKLIRKSKTADGAKIRVPKEDENDGYVKDGDFKGFRIYETHHFRFLSEVSLSEDAMENIGRLFECSYAAIQSVATILPIVRITPKKSRRGEKLDANAKPLKLTAVIFKDVGSYQKSGAPKGTAGYFTYKSKAGTKVCKESDLIDDRLNLYLASIGVSEEGELEATDFDSHTLVHEMTHQFTCLNMLPIWVNEALSEYMGYTPYDGGDMDFKVTISNIVMHARYRSRNELLDFPFSLEDYLLMSQEDMYRYMEKEVDTYMLSSMIVAYFIHLDRKGVDKLKAYLTALAKGKDNEDCIKLLLEPKQTMEDLEMKFIESWEKQEVHATFNSKVNWGD